MSQCITIHFNFSFETKKSCNGKVVGKPMFGGETDSNAFFFVFIDFFKQFFGFIFESFFNIIKFLLVNTLR